MLIVNNEDLQIQKRSFFNKFQIQVARNTQINVNLYFHKAF